jgi:CRP-like cAMP-binding protein
LDNRVLFSGKIDFIPLEDLFHLMGSNKATGILRLISRYVSESGLVYFKNGNIVNAASGSLTGLNAVFSLFGWTDAEFEFVNQGFNIEHVIKKNLMEIILDGLRMVDEGEIEKIGPISFDAISRVSSSRPTVRVPVIRGPLVDFEYVVELEDFVKGQEIVHEKGYGDWIWVILRGTVEIINKTKAGPLRILRVGEGSFLGSIASFLYKDNVRGATVETVGDVQLGVLDMQRLSLDFMSMSREFRQILISLDKRLREVTYSVTDFYSGNDTLREAATGREVLIKQGGDQKKVFSIVAGNASVVRRTESGPVVLADLGQGDFIGRFPFYPIDHEPGSAFVLASQDLKLKELNLDFLLDEYERIPNTLKNMTENVATCLSITSRLACDYYRDHIA